MMEETTIIQQIPETSAELPKADEAANGKVGFWTCFGLMALFAVPIIGWIAGIVFMFAPKRKSLKNFARATMAWALVGVLFFVSIFLALQAVVVSLLNNQFGFKLESIGQIVSLYGEIQDGNYIAVLPYIGDDLVDEIVDSVGEEYEEVVREVIGGEYNELLEDIQDRKFENISEDFDDGKYDELIEMLDEETYTNFKDELSQLKNGETPQWLADFENMIPEF